MNVWVFFYKVKLVIVSTSKKRSHSVSCLVPTTQQTTANYFGSCPTSSVSHSAFQSLGVPMKNCAKTRNQQQPAKFSARKWVIAVVTALVAALGIGIGIWKYMHSSFAKTTSSTGEATMFKLSGDPVSNAEYLQAARAVKQQVQGECVSKYGARLEDEDFWSRSYQGHIPSREAATSALAQLKNWRAAFSLFQEAGLIKDASFTGLQRDLERTNQENKQKIDLGQPVYGLQSYDLATFISYRISSLTQQYVINPKNPGMEFSEDELRSFYASRQWTDKQGRKAGFEQVRPQAVKALREEKLTKLITERVEKLLVQDFSIEGAAKLIEKEFK